MPTGTQQQRPISTKLLIEMEQISFVSVQVDAHLWRLTSKSSDALSNLFSFFFSIAVQHLLYNYVWWVASFLRFYICPDV